jgi:2-dehydropantoate 2-reductase
MKIAVMGAGGIGGYVGGRLAQAGADVTLIARGAHLDALRRNGLVIETPAGTVHLPDVRAVGDPVEVGELDLVLFTVKLADAEGAAASLAPMLGPKTRVLTLQNGIDSKAIIERHVGPGRVAEGIIYLAAYIREPGVIWHPGGVHLARAEASPGDSMMAALFAMNDRLVDLDILPDDNARQMVWGKFVNLAAFAGVTSIARSPIGRVYETPATLDFFRDLLAENLTIARAEGLSFQEDHVDATIELFRNQPYDQKSSMLVDLEAGKPIEMPWLSGRVSELAATHGIDAPANRAVVAALMPYVNGTPAR